MPLSLEPGQQFPIVLDSDADKPKESQPTFFCKSQAMRGQLKLGKVFDLYTDNPDIELEDLFQKTVDALSEVIVGWKNMGDREYSRDALMDILSWSEARELLQKVMYNRHLTFDEKKS